METKRRTHTKTFALYLATALAGASAGCSTASDILALNPNSRRGPIANPFPDYNPKDNARDNIVLRTKKGDRAVEVELPNLQGQISDLVIPVSPAFRDAARGPASASDDSDSSDYRTKKPTMTDREIAQKMQSVPAGGEGDQRDIEDQLGLANSEEGTPSGDISYLAAMDQLKSLYCQSRYEIALRELDEVLRVYPTDPKLYQMRGTLLERVGRTDMALKAWTQALRLDPNNQSLKRFIERKEVAANRTTASTSKTSAPAEERKAQ